MGWATLSAAANRVAFDRLGSVSVVAGAVTGQGFLMQNSELILGGELTITLLRSIGEGFEVHDMEAPLVHRAIGELRTRHGQRSGSVVRVGT